MVVEILSINTAFFSFLFFSWEGAWVLYIMCIGAKLQYKPLYIHCKFILGITFLCSCNYKVILQRILKLSGSIISFLVYITMPWSKPVLKAHAIKAKIARYYTMQFGNIREIEFYTVSPSLSPACSPTA